MKNIFVSSTFKDFQYERDWLRNKVLPLLNREASKYGDYVQFCDLRWGIDTTNCSEEERDRKILSVCLNEIDRTAPYTVILLGDRYGYVANDLEEVSKIVKTRGSDFEKQLDSLSISVTQLEIEYALYQNIKQSEKIFVYFREIEEGSSFFEEEELEQNKEKLKKLKNRLKKIFGDKVYTYKTRIIDGKPDCEDTFVQLVMQNILDVLQKEWKCSENLLPYEKEYEYHWNYLHMRRYGYVNTAELSGIQRNMEDECGLIKYDKDLLNREAVFAQVCMMFLEKGYKVIPMFCTKTEDILTEHDIRQYIIGNIENVLGVLHEERTLDEIYEMCEQQKKNILIALCGIEKIKMSEKKGLGSFFTKQKFAGVKYYITGDFENKEDLLNVYRENGFIVTITNEKKSKDWLETSFSSMGKELSNDVKIQYAAKTKTWKPFYEQFAIKLLVMLGREDFEKIDIAKKQNMDDMQAIREYLCSIINERIPKEQELIFHAYISEIIHQLQAVWLEDVVRYMAVLKYGVRKEDFEKLLAKKGKTFDYLSFISMVYFDTGIFEESVNGCFRFANEEIRKAFLCGMSAKEQYIYVAELHRYFESVPKSNVLQSKIKKSAEAAGYRIYFCNAIIKNLQQEDDKKCQNDVQKMADWILDQQENNEAWFIEALQHFSGYNEAYSNLYYLAYFFVFYICKKEIFLQKYEIFLVNGHGFLYKIAKIHNKQELWFLLLEYAIYVVQYFEKCNNQNGVKLYYHFATLHIEECKDFLEKGKLLELYENVLEEMYERISH